MLTIICLGILLFLYVANAAILTALIYHAYWKHQKDYTLYDLVFKKLSIFDKGELFGLEVNVREISITRWIPFFNFIVVHIYLLMALVVFTIVIPFQYLTKWMRNVHINQTPDLKKTDENVGNDQTMIV